MDLMDSGAIEPDTPGGPRPRSERARRSWKAWEEFLSALDYARGDPGTFYVPIDRAAHMAGLSQRNFYNRHLLSGNLTYVVKTWFHGRRRRRKSFVPRAALLSCSRANCWRPPGCTCCAAMPGKLSRARLPRLIWSGCSTASDLRAV
jgi:hypothetical protein